MGVRYFSRVGQRNFSRGAKSTFCYPFQVAEDAMQMDVHKTLYHRTQRSAPCYAVSTLQRKCPTLRQHFQKCASLAAMVIFHSCFFLHCIKLSGCCYQQSLSRCITCHRCPRSVARWLSPKPAKWCHEKLLDSAKNLVTNFQQTSGKNSDILPKICYFWGD